MIVYYYCVVIYTREQSKIYVLPCISKTPLSFHGSTITVAVTAAATDSTATAKATTTAIVSAAAAAAATTVATAAVAAAVATAAADDDDDVDDYDASIAADVGLPGWCYHE